MTDLNAVEAVSRDAANPDQIEHIARRVARDQVVRMRMREVVDLVKKHRDLDLTTVRELLRSRRFEIRMVAVSIFDLRTRRESGNTRTCRTLHPVPR